MCAPVACIQYNCIIVWHLSVCTCTLTFPCWGLQDQVERLQYENRNLREEREKHIGVIEQLEKDLELQHAEVQRAEADLEEEVTRLQKDKQAVREQLQQESDRLHSQIERQQLRVCYHVHIHVVRNPPHYTS